jgi:hypothetical protein
MTARLPWKDQQSNLGPLPNYTVNTSPDKFQVVWTANPTHS